MYLYYITIYGNETSPKANQNEKDTGCVYIVSPVFYRTTDCNSWTAEIPRKISAVKGSCVNIPCHFNYPGPRHPARDFVGIWYHGFFTAMVYNSKDISLVNAKFRHRTKLTGSLESNNCSLQIINLTPEDSLTYMFRVEIKGTQKYSYTQVTSQLIVSGK